MSDGPCENQLLFEPLENARMSSQLRPDHLQRNQAIDLLVSCFVDRPHPAFAKQFENLVTIGDYTADFKRQSGT